MADQPIDDPFDPVGLDRALAQRDPDRTRHLVTLEGHAAAIGLDHDKVAQLHAFDGGEALPARPAYAPAPDGRAIFMRAAVLYLRIVMSTKRAPHAKPFPDYAMEQITPRDRGVTG
ncbi:hypothetical protein AA16373_0441 [Komagataeibacter swingsii DSM 16373]|nr:hypothetical protein AA16373_0441 [Komagataeibacter swingsii DSM 16373]